MEFNTLIDLIRKLKIRESRTIYKTWSNEKIFVLRPEKQSATLKRKYKRELNFQIWLQKSNGLEFKPNHLRVLIDFYLKKMSRPDLSKTILECLEKIFNGGDPEKIVGKFKDEEFRMKIDDIDTNFYLTQLFFVEQAINYTHGKVQPPQAFLMGYLRVLFETDVEIDKMCWSAPRNPPPPKFWRR